MKVPKGRRHDNEQPKRYALLARGQTQAVVCANTRLPIDASLAGLPCARTHAGSRSFVTFQNRQNQSWARRSRAEDRGLQEGAWRARVCVYASVSVSVSVQPLTCAHHSPWAIAPRRRELPPSSAQSQRGSGSYCTGLVVLMILVVSAFGMGGCSAGARMTSYCGFKSERVVETVALTRWT